MTAILKTPLYAAFFYVAVVAGCGMESPQTAAADSLCPAQTTPIARVQANAKESPMRGQQVTVKGVVTLLQDGQGLYIEEPGSDSDDRTSNAVFVEIAGWPTGVEKGTLVSAQGEVSEIGKGRYKLTAITAVDELINCGITQALPLTNARLPLNGPGRESLEGMRIAIKAPLTVTDVYRFDRGDITLSSSGLLLIPTEVTEPGDEANRRRAQNRASTLSARMGEAGNQVGLLASGTVAENITGVLAHDGYDLRISMQSITIDPPAGLPIPIPVADGALRVAGLNLHNYFNGDGQGRGFPTSRGAETEDEFQQQRDRVGAAIKLLDPHLFAVQELENDGFGPASAAQDLIQLANKATGGNWAVARPVGDDTGSDAITVGLFYRDDLVRGIGPAKTLTGPEWEKSRQPMAQVFQPAPGGEKILIVVNHLKSKGSCPENGENADQKDGQGCWNPMRTAAAKIMSDWAKTLAASAGIENILILGDMNAYRLEDPISAIREAGFTELVEVHQGQAFSFAFRGQHGTLDYAFSSRALQDNVVNAFIWNVNAVFPPNVTLPEPWMRFSDHDPVVVDGLLRHSMTSD